MALFDMLDFDGDAATRRLARLFLGEATPPEGQAPARSVGQDQRIMQSALLGMAQGLAPAMRPSLMPQPGLMAMLPDVLAGGFHGAAQQQAYQTQLQRHEMQLAQQRRELARQAQVRQLLGGMLTAGRQPGAAPGAVPAAAPGSVAGSIAGAGAAAPAAPMLDEGAPLDMGGALALPSVAGLPGTTRDIFASAVADAGLSGPAADTFARMLRQESGGRHTDAQGRIRTSSKGAIGLAQVMPATFRETAERYGIEGAITDPVANLRTGALYFRDLLRRFDGDMRLAVQAYNAGPNRIDRVRAGEAELPEETRQYEAAVLGSAPGAPRHQAAVQQAASAISQATGAPVSVSQAVLGLAPQDAMMLLMLPDDQLAKTLGEIVQKRAVEGAGPGVRLLSVQEAAAAGLPTPQTTRYQMTMRGADAGKISPVSAGGTTINLPAQGQRGLLELDLKRVEGAHAAADAGARIAAPLRTIQQSLMSGTQTGLPTQALLATGSALEAVGALGRDELQNLNQARVIQAMIASIVPNMRPVGSGSTSDRDLTLYQQAAPRIANSPIANLLITGGYVQVNEAQRREAERMEEYARENGGSLAGYRERAQREPIEAFPRISNDDAGRARARQVPPGTVVVLPSGGLGVKMPDGSIDDGSGERYRATIGARGR